MLSWTMLFGTREPGQWDEWTGKHNVTLDLSTGAYYNSYRLTTVYGMADYRPLAFSCKARWPLG